jgi:hypothetical protein
LRCRPRPEQPGYSAPDEPEKKFVSRRVSGRHTRSECPRHVAGPIPRLLARRVMLLQPTCALATHSVRLGVAGYIWDLSESLWLLGDLGRRYALA